MLHFAVVDEMQKLLPDLQRKKRKFAKAFGPKKFCQLGENSSLSKVVFDSHPLFSGQFKSSKNFPLFKLVT